MTKMSNAFGAGMPSPIAHTPTPPAGNTPSRGSYKPSGMEQAMGAHADKVHPVGKASPRTSARMMGETTHDRKASGGF